MTQKQVNTPKYKNVTIIVTSSVVTSNYLILKMILPFVTKHIIEGEHFLYFSSPSIKENLKIYFYLCNYKYLSVATEVVTEVVTLRPARKKITKFKGNMAVTK
jgi:hypothetical protein